MECVINKKRLTDVGETNYRKYQSKRQVRRMTKVGSYVRVRVHVCMYVCVYRFGSLGLHKMVKCKKRSK